MYAAGELIREGRGRELYDIEPMAAIEHRVEAEADLEHDSLYGPFLNPPFFALAYVPLAMLPYREAAAVWLTINLLLLAGSVLLLCRMLPRECDWRTKGLIPLLLVLPIPFWQAMCHQQNTFLSLLLLCAIVTLWRGPEIGSGTVFSPRVGALAAGAATGLLFYKPQLALVVSIALVTTSGLAALVGLVVSGSALLLVTVLALPGTLTAYLHRLPPTIFWMQQQLGYNWGRQVTPQAFWRLLLQGHVRGQTQLAPKVLAAFCTIAVAAALYVAVRRYLRGRGATLDAVIAATIVSMPLLMPYYMDYDLLLLAVPAVLFAGQWMRRDGPPSRVERLQLGAWVILFFVMYAGPGTASHTRVHPTLIAIATVALAAVAGCMRTATGIQGEEAMQCEVRAAA